MVNVKLIRDKNTMQHSGYGFVEFQTRAVAEQVLLKYSAQPIPSTSTPSPSTHLTVAIEFPCLRVVLVFLLHTECVCVHV